MRKCDHSNLWASIKRLEQEKDGIRSRMTAGIEKLMGSHTPYPDPTAIRPGNTRDVPFYCERCRVPWPCPTFEELRWLFKNLYEENPSVEPYDRLVLRQAERDV